MHEVSDELFNDLIASSLDELPSKYTSKLENVLITYADYPSDEQRTKLSLRCNQTLLGLYEGVPLPARGIGYNLVLPDRITLFKYPLIGASHDMVSLRASIKHTLWHEIAHYFGLNHDRIHEIEHNWQ
ncbi:metallopeptidase family protein [Candidatus Saccharibacteria bacterium]|nr:metallopeptidase family protein [Candidatus Saccharibacteria bacterium]